MNKKPTDSQRMRVNDFFWIVDLLSMFGIGKIEHKKNNRQHRFVVHSREFRHRLEIKSIEIISYLVEWTQRGKYTLIKIKCKYAFKMALCLYGGGQQFGTTLDFSCVSFNFLMTFFQSYFIFVRFVFSVRWHQTAHQFKVVQYFRTVILCIEL